MDGAAGLALRLTSVVCFGGFQVIEAGASGIAVMRGISGAEDAEEAARAYKEALEHSWREMKRKA